MFIQLFKSVRKVVRVERMIGMIGSDGFGGDVQLWPSGSLYRRKTLGLSTESSGTLCDTRCGICGR